MHIDGVAHEVLAPGALQMMAVDFDRRSRQRHHRISDGVEAVDLPRAQELYGPRQERHGIGQAQCDRPLRVEQPLRNTFP